MRFACAFAVLCALTIAFTFKGEAKVNSKSSVAFAQKELILQIQGLTVKNYTDVRTAIETNPGVTFKDYCFSNNTIMYVIDSDLHSDYQFVDNALAPFNLTYLVKDGTITQVQSSCEDVPQDDNSTE